MYETMDNDIVQKYNLKSYTGISPKGVAKMTKNIQQ